MEKFNENRGLLKYIIFCIITLGIYSLYLLYREAKETNAACAEDGQHTRGLLGLLFLSLITFGIYGLVWRCNWISRCNNFLTRNQTPQGLQISTYLPTVFLLGHLTLGIMYFVVTAKELYLQNSVNHIYNAKNNLV